MALLRPTALLFGPAVASSAALFLVRLVRLLLNRFCSQASSASAFSASRSGFERFPSLGCHLSSIVHHLSRRVFGSPSAPFVLGLPPPVSTCTKGAYMAGLLETENKHNKTQQKEKRNREKTSEAEHPHLTVRVPV